MTFWQYLKGNGIVLFLIFTGLVILLQLYWVIRDGLADAATSIYWCSGITLLMWIVWVIGSYADYKDGKL